MTIQSFQPEHDAGELDEAEEVGGEFVIAGGDSAPLLESGKETFDAPSVLVGDAIIVTGQLAMAARRNDDTAPLSLDFFAEAIGIIGFVCQDLFRLKAVDQFVRGGYVVLLARSQFEANRQAQGIDYGVDFGSKATA